MTTRSQQLLARAQQVIPGGVNSPVRAFAAVGGHPPFIQRGFGARVVDVDGREYIDYVGSWGPLILGHAHPAVVRAMQQAAAGGSSFGAPTEAEVELAEALVRRTPSVEMVRLVNSGTEATMTAARLARAVTGRDLLIKFDGCYHGHADAFLVKAGSGAATLGVPSSAGVPPATAGQTLVASFNDIESVERLMVEHPGEVAAVIVEPVVGNSGVIPPVEGFLQALVDYAHRHGALTIFDEVMTGFRVHPQSAQGLYGVLPDLTTLGKVIGGGMPIGAVGGRADIMRHLAPCGTVYQAGTLSGNPVAVAAGLATLALLDQSVYDRLEALSLRLERGIVRAISDGGYPCCVQRVGSMCCLFFAFGPVRSAEDLGRMDAARFTRYFTAMLARGIYMPPSAYETFFVSAAHAEADIDFTIRALGESLSEAYGDSQPAASSAK